METAFEYLLTHTYKTDLTVHMSSHPGDFAELLQLALANKQPYSWRAAWLLWSCMEKNDPRLRKHVGSMVAALAERPDNQIRELLMILQKMEIPERYQGRLFDQCINIWGAVGKQPSVRCNAFKMLHAIVERHPELRKEITFLTEPRYMDSLSPGVRHSIRKLMAHSANRGGK
jgi:hypothetical protein